MARTRTSSGRRPFALPASSIAAALLAFSTLPGLPGEPERGPSAPSPVPTVELNVLVVLYTSTFSRTLAPDEIARLHREVAEFQQFYEEAVGEGMRLSLRLLRIDRTLQPGEIGQVGPDRYYLAREDIEEELEAYGMEKGPIDEVIAFYAWDNINREGAVLAYGGGAVGPDGRFLGDAGFNSQGVFAWDPGRISQILIHEVLHNIDDMFGRSGMSERFFNADEMSRNMARMLSERPGLFLPDYDDAYMLRWAGRERRGEEGYPWEIQLKYYRWMLNRTPAQDWLRLAYGERVEDRPRPPVEPLYREAAYPQETGRVYALVRAPAGAGRPSPEGREVALVGRKGLAGRFPLEPVESPHTGFDGRTIFSVPLWEGTVPLAERDRQAGSIRLAAEVGGGQGGAAEIEIETVAPAYAPEVTIESPEPGWGIEVEGTTTAQVGRPFTLYLRARERGAVVDASIRVRIGDQTYRAEQTAPGAYEVNFPSLPPGTPELVIEAARRFGDTFRKRVLIPVEYRGTIVAPQRVTARAGERVRIEAHLRDRMGKVVRDVRVPLVLIAGDGAVMMPAAAPGDYFAELLLPVGTHRLVVASLEGRGLYRRMITAEIGPGEAPGSGVRVIRPEVSGLPSGVAVARRTTVPVQVDGDLAEWTIAPSIRLGSGSAVLTDPAYYTGPRDLSADLWIAWEPGNLYVAGRVRDDVTTFGEQWDSDRLNLVFDMNNDTTPLTYGTPEKPARAAAPDRWTPDDYWVFARLFTGREGGSGRVIRVGKELFQEEEQVSYRGRRTEDGYTFELAIPAPSLPAYGEGFAGKVIGFQVFFTDGDGEPTVTELMWAGRWGYDSGGIHWEMCNMGRLLFAGAPLP